jgi:hypothetical protein
MAYNKLTLEEKLLTKAAWQGECLIWFGQKCPKGYGRLRLEGKMQRAHRLMYQIKHGPIADGQVVRHSCDTPSCINPNHLSLGTQADNVHDMCDRGRTNRPKGEQHPKAKLTDSQVAEIRRRYVPGAYGKGAHCLAKEFGVSKQGIQAILSGKSRR